MNTDQEYRYIDLKTNNQISLLYTIHPFYLCIIIYNISICCLDRRKRSVIGMCGCHAKNIAILTYNSK